VVNQREQFGSKSEHLQACVFVCESFGGNFFRVNDSSSRFLKEIKKKKRLIIDIITSGR